MATGYTLRPEKKALGKPERASQSYASKTNIADSYGFGDPFAKHTVKPLLKPDDQLDLKGDDLNEEIARILLTKGLQAPDNLIEYSYRERQFIKTPKPGWAIEKYNLDGKRILKSSPEGELQLLHEAGTHKTVNVYREAIQYNEDDEDEDKPKQKAKPKPAESSEKPSEEVATETEGEPAAKPAEESGEEEESDEEEKSPKKSTRAESIQEEVALFGTKKVMNEFNYCQREAMTYNNPVRSKLIQTDPICIGVFNAHIMQWVIYDGYEEDQAEIQRLRDIEYRKDPRYASTMPPILNLTDKQLHDQHEQEVAVKMEQAALTIERMINQNTYDDIAQDYRYWDDPSDEYKNDGSLLVLWKLVYDKTKELTVTSLCWNPCYYDYFAVAFGSFDFTKPVTQGSVCLFSLKNPSYPDFICFRECGVMCVDIHPKHPYYLVAGLYDGNVIVYNVRLDNEPVYASDQASGKHTSIVWQCKWVDDTPDEEINFYSISGDGFICNWMLHRAELCRTVVITLDIPGPPVLGPYSTTVRRSRCGSYIAFHPTQPLIYLAGTEEGVIHKNTTVYSSVALHMYHAHTLPVHKIDFNKFYADVFASCSADFKINIWLDMRDEPLYSFDLGASVGDVEWAPFSSTIFAACTQDGRVHIFDLNIDKYRPICVQFVVSKKKNRLTRLAFNDKLPFLIVGDDKGCATSLKLSPNLRKKVKPSKKGPRYTMRELEIMKLEKILASVIEPVSLDHPPDVGVAPY